MPAQRPYSALTDPISAEEYLANDWTVAEVILHHSGEAGRRYRALLVERGLYRSDGWRPSQISQEVK